MSDNLSYAWRNKPLGDVMPTSRLLDNLERAGYITAGDVMDVDAETLAADVKGVGPKRAAMIRDDVFEEIRDDVFEDAQLMARLGDAEIERVYPSRPVSIYGDDSFETTPSLADTFMTIAALLGVALVVYMLARMVL
jgi:hypothetical protein